MTAAEVAAGNATGHPRFPGRRHWAALALACLLPVMTAALAKVVRHELPLHWDEASYIDQAYEDAARLKSGVAEGVRGFFTTGRDKPPAYRVLHQPLTLLAGVSPLSLRIAALLALACTITLSYAAASSSAGRHAGVLAALLVGLAPAILSSSSQFGTEYPLFPAVAGMLWILSRLLYRGPPRAADGVLLGLFLGMGFLAKANFVVFATPAIVLWLAACYFERSLAAIRKVLLTGIAVGVATAAPWWALNVKPVYWQTRYASDFARHAWPFDSWILKGLTYVAFVCECGFGYPLAVLAAIVPGCCFFPLRRSAMFGRERRDLLMIATCFASAGALLATQFLGRNQNARHAAPAILAIGVALGIAAGRTGLVNRPWFFSASALGALLQVTFMLTGLPWDRPVDRLVGFIGDTPSRVFHTYDQWDWGTLRDMCIAGGLERENLRVAHVGSGFAFNPPQIAFPWASRNEKVDVRILWHYEDGDPDWSKILAWAAEFDVVLTAPGYVGARADKQDLDNRYNGVLAERLASDPRFIRAGALFMGTARQEVDVFFRVGGSGRSPGGAPNR